MSGQALSVSGFTDSKAELEEMENQENEEQLVEGAKHEQTGLDGMTDHERKVLTRKVLWKLDLR